MVGRLVLQLLLLYNKVVGLLGFGVITRWVFSPLGTTGCVVYISAVGEIDIVRGVDMVRI